MIIKTSWDDGNRLDIKVAHLLKRYGLPGIFFIPNLSDHTDISQDEIKYLVYEGFELGGHTTTHPQDMKELSHDRIVHEVAFNKGWLEGITGKPIDWFCYPRGRYDNRVLNAVRDAGYKYARTTVVGWTGIWSENDLRIKTAVHVFQRPEYGKEDWLDYAKRKFEAAKFCDGTFHLWGHSWEVEKFNYWDKLEELFKFIKYGKDA